MECIRSATEIFPCSKPQYFFQNIFLRIFSITAVMAAIDITMSGYSVKVVNRRSRYQSDHWKSNLIINHFLLGEITSWLLRDKFTNKILSFLEFQSLYFKLILQYLIAWLMSRFCIIARLNSCLYFQILLLSLLPFAGRVDIKILF